MIFEKNGLINIEFNKLILLCRECRAVLINTCANIYKRIRDWKGKVEIDPDISGGHYTETNFISNIFSNNNEWK